MAQVVVNTAVMRDKANTIGNAADTIQSLFDQMLNEVTTTANSMEGNTIEAQKESFKSMKPTFERIVEDMKNYKAFLENAAEYYGKVEEKGTTEAEEQGKVF